MTTIEQIASLIRNRTIPKPGESAKVHRFDTREIKLELIRSGITPIWTKNKSPTYQSRVEGKNVTIRVLFVKTDHGFANMRTKIF